jgi:DtxR family Mn-dependent transcriptional regulator
MRDNLTHAIEDYLKTIYDLCATHGRATTNQIAERLGVTPASVTNMIKKLSITRPPLLEYRKHRGVVLTPDGNKVALEILRHHRLLEMFLHQTLGYGWDEVHEEADRLEHVISEEFEERMAESLGHPAHDPHGHPIPTRELELPLIAASSLSSLRRGQQALVKRVPDDDSDLLRYLSELGLIPGVYLTVLAYSPFDDNLKIQIEGQPTAVVLGPAITERVFVEVL